MSYFPFFIDIEGKTGVIVGGGAVAWRKVQALLPFGVRLKVVAPQVVRPLKELAERPDEPLILCERTYVCNDLEDAFFVIAATDDKQINHEVAVWCREHGVLVNAVDQKEDCTFFFPALVKRGEVVAGISTGGGSPTMAGAIRRELDRQLPDYYGDVCGQLGQLREQIREQVEEESERKHCMEELFRACREHQGVISQAQIEAILRKYIHNIS